MKDHFSDLYRPKTLDEFIGNTASIEILRSQIADNKLSHSWLFFGPFGTGKTSLARIVASSLDAQVIEHDCGADSAIENIREVVEYSRLGSILKPCKVYILDEVHKLSKAAQDTLLKVVEEPASGTYWILCTTEPGKINLALRSRCLEIALRPAGKEEMRVALKRVLRDHPFKLENPDDYLTLLDKAGGSLRVLYNLLQKITSSGEAVISSEKFAELLGAGGGGEGGLAPTNRIPQLLLSGDLGSYLAEVAAVRKSGVEPAGVLIGVYEYLKKAVVNDRNALRPLQLASEVLTKHLSEVSWFSLEYLKINSVH